MDCLHLNSHNDIIKLEVVLMEEILEEIQGVPFIDLLLQNEEKLIVLHKP